MPRDETAALADQLAIASPLQISQALASEHPADFAAALQEIGPERAWPILDAADKVRQADVFGYLDPDFQAALATIMPRQDLVAIFVEMNADDRADLYKKLSQNNAKR